ncbi:hypothetical protein BDV24DRAFT_173847 [Aspergillus arachidicola]|uniref:Multidrug resistance-associated protein n=1 Tax=Aspergillus arachidicola TaxID=656916 RepID=A0A5N6YDM3_9EURO|nr:hypothetical protein BDV24DRAFT_173847 [Aspergillus arachidicola]
MPSSLSSSTCPDGWLGPVVVTPGCRGGFDFTVLFESSFLNIAPAACFLLFAPARILQLSKEPRKVASTPLRLVVLVKGTSAIFVAIQVALLILVAKLQAIGGPTLLVSTVLDLIVAITMLALLDLEHVRSIRPSFLAAAYLFVASLLNISRVRTAWLLPDSQGYSACLSTSLAISLILLILENVGKRKWLLPSEKTKSEESTSGLFGRGIFAWLISLLQNGYSALLTGASLPRIHENLSSRRLSTRFLEAWELCDQNRQNSLLLVVLKCLRREIWQLPYLGFFVVGLSIAQPFIIGRAVVVLQQADRKSLNMGYGLIGAFAIVFIGIAVCKAAYEHMGYRTTSMLRGGLMFLTVCETWANVLQLGLATWLLQTQIGIVCIAPIVLAIIFIAASFTMGNAAAEQRINLTSSILGNIRNVKLLGLTENMRSMIEALRVKEIAISKKFRHVQTVRVCMVNLPIIAGQLATFAAYAIVAAASSSNGLSVSQAIISLSLITLMINPLSMLLFAIPNTFASIACLHRIEGFMRHPKRHDKRLSPQVELEVTALSSNLSEIALSPISQTLDQRKNCVLSLQDVRFGWKRSSSGTAAINLSIHTSSTGTLVMIIGQVGSGKSTFLRGLAGETTVLDGLLYTRYSDMAFCEQVPWLTNASIRDNIVGQDHALEFDAAWYRTVVNACALAPDLDRMPAGDQTLVGSNGVKLSGGQKQRIAIARAVYSRKRIACFDDVLSGLDNKTSALVFDKVFGSNGLLRRMGCTVFFTTHNTRQLSQSDLIIVLGDNGDVLEKGTYTELQGRADGYIQACGDQEDKDNDFKEEEAGIDQCPNHQGGRTSPLAATPTAGDNRKTTDISVYKYYFSALGWLRILVFLALVITDTGFGAFRGIWIELWSSSGESNLGTQLAYWLGFYGLFCVIQAVALALTIFYAWVIVVPAASKTLHRIVLNTCMSAPLSFFTRTDTGSLVTRFSQDMRLVDMILPRGFLITTIQFFNSVAQGAVAVASLPYLAAVIPFVIGLIVLVQRFYLRTSRQLRLLEIELKSPLYAHFIESLVGIATIRAFSWTDACTAKMISVLDMAQKPYYLLLCIQNWLALVLNLIAAVLTVALVGAAFALRSRINPGLLGVALVMMMDLGQTLSELIQNWTLLETSLGAIARIRDFANQTPTEEPDVTSQLEVPSPDWPIFGEVKFMGAEIAYGKDEPESVLKNIDLHIRAGQKFGLCGRTGSSKSTLALSLLRLNEIVSGHVLIDGADLSRISRSFLRQQISCIGQEPFLFPGSIRQNVDPQNTLQSTEISLALRQVGVWDALSKGQTEDEEAVLDAKLDDATLSQGQKQLFCLARAFLKRSKILILDEPTSSVDSKTDAKIQEIIRKMFSQCTVIMVAHRISTLLDFDQVAVLDSGQIVEVGSPSELLGRTDGKFSGLWGLESSSLSRK